MINLQETDSGVFPNYLNISTTDNKGISEFSTNEEYTLVSIIKNNTMIIPERITIRTEIVSKENHLTIAST